MFHTRASNPGDYVRVLTEFSPKAKRITKKLPESTSPVDMLGVLLGWLRLSLFV